MHELFGPKATANRILDFAQGLINKYMAMEGKDQEKLARYIEKLIKAIDKGFGMVNKGRGQLPHDIGGMIGETYDRVMNGMDAIRGELEGRQEATRTITYEEEITYTEASMEISIMA